MSIVIGSLSRIAALRYCHQDENGMREQNDRQRRTTRGDEHTSGCPGYRNDIGWIVQDRWTIEEHR